MRTQPLSRWLRHVARLAHRVRRVFLHALFRRSRGSRSSVPRPGVDGEGARELALEWDGHVHRLRGELPTADPERFPMEAYAEATAPWRRAEAEWVQCVQVDRGMAARLWLPADAPSERAGLLVVHALPQAGRGEAARR